MPDTGFPASNFSASNGPAASNGLEQATEHLVEQTRILAGAAPMLLVGGMAMAGVSVRHLLRRTRGQQPLQVASADIGSGLLDEEKIAQARKDRRRRRRTARRQPFPEPAQAFREAAQDPSL